MTITRSHDRHEKLYMNLYKLRTVSTLQSKDRQNMLPEIQDTTGTHKKTQTWESLSKKERGTVNEKPWDKHRSTTIHLHYDKLHTSHHYCCCLTAGQTLTRRDKKSRMPNHKNYSTLVPWRKKGIALRYC